MENDLNGGDSSELVSVLKIWKEGLNLQELS
jgi:hypothetical protein